MTTFTDDRFQPQGKQILPKICQVRLMPKAKYVESARMGAECSRGIQTASVTGQRVSRKA